jgi:mitochondrial fission protein ELM1
LTDAAAPLWVLLGGRTGDNNQLLRLAGELGLPFRAIELRYNPLHVAPPALLGSSLASLDDQSRLQIQPPWPRLVLGIGYRSVPVALAIRRASEGKAKLVRLGNPRSDPRAFDLVITTPQYGVPDAPNVLRLPVGISTAPQLEPTREEREWLSKLARPHRLLLIGGETFMWSLRPERLANATEALKAKPGGSIIAVSSARTTRPQRDAVQSALAGAEHALVWGGAPRYPVLLADADEIYVTADSVAMTSDAIASRKPVGLIVPEQSALGRFFYALDSFGLGVPVRDVRRFWRSVQAQGLAGTVDHPTSARLDVDPLRQAVSAVRALLDDQAASASCGSQPR